MKNSKPSIQRRGTGPRKVSNYLASTSAQLSALQQQTTAIAALKAALWPVIPTTLQACCDVANFRGQTLVLVANSPVWAAKLRHMSPQILHAARTLCKIDAQKLQIKIQPVVQVKPPERSSRSLPARSAAHLKEVAAGVDDEELREILLTIASRGD